MSNDLKTLCTEQTLRLLRFFFLKRIDFAIFLREQFFQILRRLTGNILHGNALADVGGVFRMLEIDPGQAVIVMRIFEYKAAGLSLRKIAAALMNDGVPTPRSGRVWGPETIRTLSNEKYCGTVIGGKTYISDYFCGKQSKNNGEAPKYVMENHHEPIIKP